MIVTWKHKGLTDRRTRRPTHPGELIREDLLPETGLSQVQLAGLMGVSRRTISEIVHERRGITPDIAFRLARLFDCTPQMWLNMQQALDLWEIEASHGDEYRDIHPVQDSSSSSTTP